MPIFLCLIETMMLFLLYKKFGIKSGIVQVFFIVYIYCNAILFDIYLLNSFKQGLIFTDIGADAFSSVFLYYFLFLGVYFFLFYFYYRERVQVFYSFRFNRIINIVVISFLSFFSLFQLISNRVDIIDSTNFLLAICRAIILFYSALYILYGNGKSKIFYILLFILFVITSYERDYLVFAGVIILALYNKKINIIHLFLLASCGLFVLSYYKAFYVYIIGAGDFSAFIYYVKNNLISFSELDPIASFSLLYDYFKSTPDFYSNYELSYFTSFFDQYNRYINGEDVKSLGQLVSAKYAGNEYGLAFSMILESILNFSFLGPPFLALSAFIIYNYLKKKFYYISIFVDIIFTMFFVTFVRTELMVMIKIYIIPLILFLFVINRIINKKELSLQL